MTVWIAVTCPSCKSTDVVKNGKSRQGKQRYCYRKRKALSYGQTQRLKREFKEFNQGQRTTFPELLLMIKLQAAINEASKNKPNLTTFIGRLQSLDIDIRPYISDKGRKRISYRLEDLKVRGSKLHNASFPKLLSRTGY